MLASSGEADSGISPDAAEARPGALLAELAQAGVSLANEHVAARILHAASVGKHLLPKLFFFLFLVGATKCEEGSLLLVLIMLSSAMSCGAKLTMSRPCRAMHVCVRGACMRVRSLLCVFVLLVCRGLQNPMFLGTLNNRRPECMVEKMLSSSSST